MGWGQVTTGPIGLRAWLHSKRQHHRPTERSQPVKQPSGQVPLSRTEAYVAWLAGMLARCTMSESCCWRTPAGSDCPPAQQLPGLSVWTGWLNTCSRSARQHHAACLRAILPASGSAATGVVQESGYKQGLMTKAEHEPAKAGRSHNRICIFEPSRGPSTLETQNHTSMSMIWPM
jgi:hypothetical protein